MSDADQADSSKSRLPSPASLFAITLLAMFALLCGWIGWRAQRQQALLNHIERLGGTVQTQPAKPIWLHDFAVAAFGSERAMGFTDVTRIGLGHTLVTDADLEPLDGLAHLELLSLQNTQVTDAGLDHLGGLTNLEYLDISGTQVTDSGLQHLSGLSNLGELNIANTIVTDAGLQQLGGLTRLRELNLTNTQITDGGVDQLQTQLPELWIWLDG